MASSNGSSRRKGKGFVGVDFDKTLATHRTGSMAIGKPIKPMVKKVKRMLSEGKDVRIFTARPKSVHPKIKQWTKENLGKALPVTNKKQHNMYRFYDDRAVHVNANRGTIRKRGRYSA